MAGGQSKPPCRDLALITGFFLSHHNGAHCILIPVLLLTCEGHLAHDSTEWLISEKGERIGSVLETQLGLR